MKKMITIFSLLLLSSTAFAAPSRECINKIREKQAALDEIIAFDKQLVSNPFLTSQDRISLRIEIMQTEAAAISLEYAIENNSVTDYPEVNKVCFGQ